MKDVVIFSNKLANELIENGFNIKRVGLNKKDNKETIFYFENTGEIRDYLKVNKNIYVK